MMNSLFSKIIFTVFLLGSTLTLFAHVELDNPKGGEVFVSGSTVTIQWHITITHVTLNWDLLFSPDGGTTWEAIHMDIPAGALSYQWHVPDLSTTQARVSIIQDNEGQDYQDESTNFTIQSNSTSIPTIPDFEVRVHPNPASDMLAIEFGTQNNWPSQIILFDVMGQSVWRSKVISKTILIPVDELTSGIYYLQFKLTNSQSSRTIFVE
jgi:hypothetical protein